MREYSGTNFLGALQGAFFAVLFLVMIVYTSRQEQIRKQENSVSVFVEFPFQEILFP